MRTWIMVAVALVGCGSSASPDGALTAASSTGGSAAQCACERGERGMQGPQGPQGERGSQGPMGNEGPQGPEGIPGLNGEPGPRGPEGAMGPRGPEGVSGQIGPRGPAGPQGPGGFDPSRIYVVENQGQFAHNGFTIVQASCDPGVDRVIAGGCNAKPYENGGQQIAKLHRFASYRSLPATWRCEAQFVEGTEPMTGDLIAQAICYDVDGNRTSN